LYVSRTTCGGLSLQFLSYFSKWGKWEKGTHEKWLSHCYPYIKLMLIIHLEDKLS
jgi:hypothetical protein